MAKALFGHVVAPAELRAERDARIAHELLSMAGDNAEPAMA